MKAERQSKIRSRRVSVTYQSLDLRGRQPRRILAELEMQILDDGGDMHADLVHLEILERLREGIAAQRGELIEKMRRQHDALRAMEDGGA